MADKVTMDSLHQKCQYNKCLYRNWLSICNFLRIPGTVGSIHLLNPRNTKAEELNGKIVALYGWEAKLCFASRSHPGWGHQFL